MNGNFGYIKTKKITEKEFKRTSMEEKDFTSKVSDITDSIEVKENLLKPEKLNTFNERKDTISNIISEVISKEKFTVNLNLKNVNVQGNKLERFVIELIPRLKEIGGSIVITNNDILSSTFLGQNGL